VVTNLASGLSATKLNHEEVLETAKRVSRELEGLMEGVIERL
jgi:purine nucleoside phosphorylase